MKFNLSVVTDLNSWSNGVLFRMFFPTPISYRDQLRFSSSSFGVLGFMFRSLIPLELAFI